MTMLNCQKFAEPVTGEFLYSTIVSNEYMENIYESTMRSHVWNMDSHFHRILITALPSEFSF